MPRRRVSKTKAMLTVEATLGRPLEEYLEEAYKAKTQAQIAEELGLDTSTLSRWMERLDIEARFQGQKPPAAALESAVA